MLRNGEQVAAGTGADVLGDPCDAMVADFGALGRVEIAFS
jgi:2-keto-4-pentenoate hydratase